MAKLDSRQRAEVAARIRDTAWTREAVQVQAAIRRLYATQVSPVPTECGYWHVYVRRGYRLPYFVEPAVPATGLQVAPDGFCAVYYSLEGRHAQGGGGGTTGLPLAVFCGRYSEGIHDTMDRAVRLLTAEVIEPSRWRWNAARGRMTGRVLGWVGCVALLGAAVAALVTMPAAAPAVQWLLDLPAVQRWGIAAAAALLALGMAGALLSEVTGWLFATSGAAAERWRMRKLDAEVGAFAFGIDAAEQVVREAVVVAQEEQKAKDYESFRTAGVTMSREDFLKIHSLLPQIRQLAGTERRRREEAAALGRKLGDGFSVPVMRLVEPYLRDAGGRPDLQG